MAFELEATKFVMPSRLATVIFVEDLWDLHWIADLRRVERTNSIAYIMFNSRITAVPLSLKQSNHDSSRRGWLRMRLLQSHDRTAHFSGVSS